MLNFDPYAIWVTELDLKTMTIIKKQAHLKCYWGDDLKKAMVNIYGEGIKIVNKEQMSGRKSCILGHTSYI